MSLSDDLRHLFDHVECERGRRYASAGAVQISRRNDQRIVAAIRGAAAYQVRLQRSEHGDWQVHCTCPMFQRRGPCKHIWAVVLVADEQRAALWQGDDGESGAAAAVRSPEAPDPDGDETRTATATERPPVSTVHDGWSTARALLEADGASRHRDPWSRAGVRGTDWAYRLHVDGHPDEGGGLALSTWRRLRRTDGEWGSPRGAHPWEHLHELPDVREQMAARRLRDAGPEDGERLGPGRYRISFALAAPLLRLLASTGRLRCQQGHGEPGPPLELDELGPWHVALRYEPADGETPGRLQGHLVRRDEQVPIQLPLLLLSDGVVLFPDRVAELNVAGDWPWLAALHRHPVVSVPASEEAELRRRLIESPPAIPLQISALPEPRAMAPRPRLDIQHEEVIDGFTRRARPRRVIAARIGFEYEGLVVAPSDARDRLVTGAGEIVERDEQAESERLREFHEHGGHPADDRAWDGEIAPARLDGLVVSLAERGWTVTAEGLPQRLGSSTGLSVRSGIDWFELEGGVSFGDQQLELPALLRALRSGQRRVLLDDGSQGLLPERWLEQWGWIGDVGERNGTIFRVPRSRGWMLDALLAARDDVQADDGFRQFSARLAAFTGVSPRREATGFTGTLRDYQRESLGWFAALRDLGLGGCLADDMGLGKTVQVLALLQERRNEHPEAPPSLVVAPRSVTANWVREAARFTPSLKVADLRGPDRAAVLERLHEYDLAVTTFGLLRRDVEPLLERRFDYVVLDEAQAIKNANSQSAKAARLLHADHRLALSGTPVENHLGELWSLFEFLNPGMLGRATSFRELLRVSEGNENGDGPGERWQVLARALRPFILRRTKEQVAPDLPERSDQVVRCDLEEQQRSDYDALAAHYREALLARVDRDGIGRSGVHVLESLLRLRQAACHPGLIDKSRVGEPSAKLDFLLDSLTEVLDEGHKALVFSQFTSFLDIVQARLVSRKITHERLDGSTRNRDERVQRFQADDACGVFLISLKAGGLGLNLTAADYVFLLDPWWNPAVERQAIDRTHRIGQTRAVMAYRLVCAGTVEERILELQGRKQALADALLGGDAFTLRDMSRDDLAWLLS